MLRFLTFALSLLTISSFQFVSAQVTWTGTTSNDWAIGSNWDSGVAPIDGDTVVIPSTPTGTNGFPVVSTVTDTVLACFIEPGASLTIASSGTFNMGGVNSFDHGFLIDHGTFTNNGIVNGFGASDFFETEGATLVNNLGATINILNDGSDPMFLQDTTTFDNFGTITINTFDNDGLCLNNNTTFTNHPSGNISITDGGGELLELDANLINMGTLNLSETVGNTSGADGIDLRDVGSFFNSGTVNITGVKNGESMELDGPFTNEGIINIDHGATSTNEAIEVENDAVVVNAICGIINVISPDSLNLESATSSFTNLGILTFAGNVQHNNLGVLTNDGVISTPNGTFALTSGSNAVVGSGTVNNGPIPATSALGACNTTTPVPTLSQWGLILLALTFLCIGGIVIHHRTRRTSAEQV